MELYIILSRLYRKQQEPLKGFKLGERPRAICIQKEHLVAMWKVRKVGRRPGGEFCNAPEPSQCQDGSLDREFKEVDSTGLDQSEQQFFVVSWPSSTHILYFRSPGDTPVTYSQLIWFSGAPP